MESGASKSAYTEVSTKAKFGCLPGGRSSGSPSWGRPWPDLEFDQPDVSQPKGARATISRSSDYDSYGANVRGPEVIRFRGQANGMSSNSEPRTPFAGPKPG